MQLVRDAGPPQDGGAAVVGLAEESQGWDPTKSVWINSNYAVAWTIFDPLAAYDASGTPQPYLAQAFDHNDDFTQWTIHLRDGVAFHDGTSLDGAAVAKNLEAQVHSVFSGAILAPVQSVVATDPRTVTVTMHTPWSTFPAVLTSQVGAIAAPAMLDNPQGAAHPIGSGAMTFASWTPGENLVVKKNTHYWQKGFVHLDSLTFKIMPDELARENAVKAGDIDVMMTTSPQQIREFTDLAANSQYQIATTAVTEDVELDLVLNAQQPPFDDVSVREAVDLALDRDALSQSMSDGVFPPAYGQVDTKSSYFVDLSGYRKHDEQRAKQLVDQYKAKHGDFTISLMLIQSPQYSAMAQIVQQQLSAAGMPVQINMTEATSGLVKTAAGQYQAIGYEVFGSPSLDREYVYIASQPGAPGQISVNVAHDLDPELKAALDRFRTTDDQKQQVDAMTTAQTRLAADHTYLPLLHERTGVIFANDIHSATEFRLPAGGTAPFGFVTNVFLGSLWRNQ